MPCQLLCTSAPNENHGGSLAKEQKPSLLTGITPLMIHSYYHSTSVSEPPMQRASPPRVLRRSDTSGWEEGKMRITEGGGMKWPIPKAQISFSLLFEWLQWWSDDKWGRHSSETTTHRHWRITMSSPPRRLLETFAMGHRKINSGLRLFWKIKYSTFLEKTKYTSEQVSNFVFPYRQKKKR